MSNIRFTGRGARTYYCSDEKEWYHNLSDIAAIYGKEILSCIGLYYKHPEGTYKYVSEHDVHLAVLKMRKMR